MLSDTECSVGNYLFIKNALQKCKNELDSDQSAICQLRMQ
jgi:hypothetical protein